MYTVILEKKFVSGMLENLTATDFVRFQDRVSAERYLKWATDKHNTPVHPCAGSSHYIIENASLQKE